MYRQVTKDKGDEKHTERQTRYLYEDGITRVGIRPEWDKKERHRRALWADRFGSDGKSHNAGTDRWPDESDKRKDQKGK